ncbi:hypothetical protein D6827_00350 [Candidatus Parcubacteria bacterium]|nr:MAG: hypothetical protein D6827_00350 [Candidatus Parcubacteria bacterium]
MNVSQNTVLLSKEQKKKLKEKILKGELDPESEVLKILVAKRFQNEPLLFAQKFLTHHFVDQVSNQVIPSPEFHYEIIETYLAHRKVAVAAPRGHAKSTITSFVYILHQAVYGFKKNIVIISASEDMAKRFLRRIREELETNKKIKWLFGVLKTDKWSETELRLANGTVIHAKGRGAQLRGLIDGATRPDLIVLDDIEDEELVRSQMRRLDLAQWFNGSVLPTLAPKVGQVIFIGTILHEDSLLSNVLNPELYPDFVSKKYKALDENDNPLWPERFSKEDLLKIKKSYIARYQLPQFFMEYMNDPMPVESATFKSEYFIYYEDFPESVERLRYEMFIDLGGGSMNKAADPTAMVVVAIDENNVIYVVDYVNKRYGTDTKALISDMIELFGSYNPLRVSIEKTVATNFLIASLKEELLERGVNMNLNMLTPTRGSGDRRGKMSDGKFQRIAAMEAGFKLGRIKMKKWMTELQEQLLAFPNASHDDIIDALAYAYMYMERTKKRKKTVNNKQIYTPLYSDIGL